MEFETTLVKSIRRELGCDSQIESALLDELKVETITPQIETNTAFDDSLGVVLLPITKTVKAAFQYIGPLPPIPVPDLDD